MIKCQRLKMRGMVELGNRLKAGPVTQWAFTWYVLDPGFNLQHKEKRKEERRKGEEDWRREGKKRQRNRDGRERQRQILKW